MSIADRPLSPAEETAEGHGFARPGRTDLPPADAPTPTSPGPAQGGVHPAVKLWRMAAFLDGEEGMDKHQWFARLTQSDPGRWHFGKTCSSFPEYHDQLWAECSPDLKRFHAGQEFVHDTGMWWDEAAPPFELESQVRATVVATTGLAWINPAPDASPSIVPTGVYGTFEIGRGTPDPTQIAREEDAYRKGYEAAKAQFAPAHRAAAPVAWRIPTRSGGWTYLTDQAQGLPMGLEWTPLYAAPVSAGPADAVAALREHHDWHLMQSAEAYADSGLCERTLAVLADPGSRPVEVSTVHYAHDPDRAYTLAELDPVVAAADPGAGRAGGFRVGISTMRENSKGESYTVTLYHPNRPKGAGILDGEGRMEVYTTYERENAKHCASEWREFFALAPPDRGEGVALPGVEEIAEALYETEAEGRGWVKWAELVTASGSLTKPLGEIAERHRTRATAIRARLAARGTAPEGKGQPVQIAYTNWRGERTSPTIIPTRIFWGSNEWHPETGWLIEALDVGKQALRTFAPGKIAAWGDASAQAAPAAGPGLRVAVIAYRHAKASLDGLGLAPRRYYVDELAHADALSRANHAVAEAWAAVETALASAVSGGGSDGWRDIATAPRDGTIVDLFTDQGSRLPNRQWLTGAERDPERCGPGKPWERLRMDGWAIAGSKQGCACLAEKHLTHWRPLPAPPTTSGAAS